VGVGVDVCAPYVGVAGDGLSPTGKGGLPFLSGFIVYVK
jgi:hypothetical protein